jgi:hypothetical protein
MLLPALAKAKAKAHQIYCLNNGKQMMVSIHMYAEDFRELFPPNEDDGNAPPGYVWVAGSAGRGGNQEFNSDILKDERTSVLTPYVAKSVTIFKCPADKRSGLYQPYNSGGVLISDPSKVGKMVDAARTFAMSQAVGTRPRVWNFGRPEVPVDGPWLNNQHTHTRGVPYQTFGKFADFGAKGAAQIWVLLDEDPYSLNDGGFAVGMDVAEWIDWPATFHNMGCGFAFADGHSEIHRWKEGSTRVIGGNVSRRPIPAPAIDYNWIKERTSYRVR